jgi:hypothetical protein
LVLGGELLLTASGFFPENLGVPSELLVGAWNEIIHFARWKNHQDDKTPAL